MTKNEILSELFTSKDFNQCIRKMKPESLQDELKAEVALILCEKPEDLIIGLADRKELRFYTVRIILNLIQSNTSPFYKKFRDTETLLFDDLPIGTTSNTGFNQNKNHKIFIEDNGYDDRKDNAISEIDNLYWYDREILKLYAEHGTYRKVEEITGIPFESIYKTIQKNCKIIRARLQA